MLQKSQTFPILVFHPRDVALSGQELQESGEQGQGKRGKELEWKAGTGASVRSS